MDHKTIYQSGTNDDDDDAELMKNDIHHLIN